MKVKGLGPGARVICLGEGDQDDLVLSIQGNLAVLKGGGVEEIRQLRVIKPYDGEVVVPDAVYNEEDALKMLDIVSEYFYRTVNYHLSPVDLNEGLAMGISKYFHLKSNMNYGREKAQFNKFLAKIYQESHYLL